ncbi:LOW QUALITY PROTEIN: probable protein phosphatase 2C 25 [Actinidia eriantha]|uniref:LOW QUALITY PROTEIN: probable protein phosphatase 2C 25 n=1 Tax=Actinidia eriantha TaxID=165200 RepID=UPI0025901744|nr:LOW QUALITY PROTEIN: probable protein phosphatase 2C 25 [Actinidia eriantha]
MPGAVAVAKSPVFTPSPRVSPVFFKPSLSSPLTVNLHRPSTSPSTPPSSLSSSSAAPLSPLTLLINKQANDAVVCGSLNSPTLLKRKRPARIEIRSLRLVFAVETPVGVDRMSEVEFEGDGYSVYCKRGRRGAMEDRYSALVDLQGDSKQAFFGIFDGHGGAKAAEFAANNIDRNIMKEVARRCEEDIEEAVKNGYLTTDAEFLKEDASGGTCCVTALIHKGDLVVSNAGDCRAVMSRGGVAEALTVDHRPCREDERKRIENLGGYVDCCRGVWRLQGSLAVSRGIGDRHLKQWVAAEPETRILRISPECEFLILASDGLWEKVSNQEAVDLVHPLCVGVDNPEPFSACKKLSDLSITRGSTDDISVMVIQLDRFLP